MTHRVAGSGHVSKVFRSFYLFISKSWVYSRNNLHISTVRWDWFSSISKDLFKNTASFHFPKQVGYQSVWLFCVCWYSTYCLTDKSIYLICAFSLKLQCTSCQFSLLVRNCTNKENWAISVLSPKWHFCKDQCIICIEGFTLIPGNWMLPLMHTGKQRRVKCWLGGWRVNMAEKVQMKIYKVGPTEGRMCRAFSSLK